MSEFKLGEHEQAIQMLLEGQDRLEKAVLEIKLSLAEKKGERRVVVWIAGIAGTLAAGLVTLLVDIGRQLLKH
jgi:hypothetical protein